MHIGALPFGPLMEISLGFYGGRRAIEDEASGVLGSTRHRSTYMMALQGELADFAVYNYELTSVQVVDLVRLCLCRPLVPSSFSRNLAV